MIRYLDTSVLIPLFLPEARSAAVRAWFRGLDLTDVMISTWTITEFASALGGEVRSRAASAEAARRADAAFQRLARRSFAQIVPAQRDFVDAARFLDNFDLGLRAGDALHVAVTRNHRAEMLVTLDKTLARAAETLGLRVELPA